jgi:hypothetical protein
MLLARRIDFPAASAFRWLLLRVRGGSDWEGVRHGIHLSQTVIMDDSVDPNAPVMPRSHADVVRVFSPARGRSRCRVEGGSRSRHMVDATLVLILGP